MGEQPGEAGWSPLMMVCRLVVNRSSRSLFQACWPTGRQPGGPDR